MLGAVLRNSDGRNAGGFGGAERRRVTGERQELRSRELGAAEAGEGRLHQEQGALQDAREGAALDFPKNTIYLFRLLNQITSRVLKLFESFSSVEPICASERRSCEWVVCWRSGLSLSAPQGSGEPYPKVEGRGWVCSERLCRSLGGDGLRVEMSSAQRPVLRYPLQSWWRIIVN